jgi:sarcosine oxidase, subunit gamma
MSEALVTVQELTDVGHINLRGGANDAAFAAAVKSVCNTALPTSANTVSQGDIDAYWLGPDEWVLLMAAEKVTALKLALDTAISGRHAAVNDLSGAFVSLRLSGQKVRELLAKGCALDLHPDVFLSGTCAHTGLAKAGVMLAVHDPHVLLVVRRSFADYLMHWLRAAGAEYGIEFI